MSACPGTDGAPATPCSNSAWLIAGVLEVRSSVRSRSKIAAAPAMPGDASASVEERIA